LAASVYAEIILRAAGHAPAPDFSSIHTAALRDAQHRVMSRSLAQANRIVNGSAQASSSSSVAATASSAAVDVYCLIKSNDAVLPPGDPLESRLMFSPYMCSWANAVVPPEEAAAAAAAIAAAVSAAIASEEAAAAAKVAAAQARISAEAQTAIDAEVAREARAASVARAAAEALRAREETLAVQAQAAADAKATVEAKAIARSQAAAEARAAAQVILTSRSRAAAQARASDAVRCILDVILCDVYNKVAALARARARFDSRTPIPFEALPEQLHAQSRGPSVSQSPLHAVPTGAMPPSPDAEALKREIDNAVAEMVLADEHAAMSLDADSRYFDICIERTAFVQPENSAECENLDPELQAVIDEISRFL
jgi:hypothetical protein